EFHTVDASLSSFRIFFFLSCSRDHRDLPSFPTRRSSDLKFVAAFARSVRAGTRARPICSLRPPRAVPQERVASRSLASAVRLERSEEHTSELQSPYDLVCRLLLEKKKNHHQPISDWEPCL